MRVLLGPGKSPGDGSTEDSMARVLAGEDGVVVSLVEAGVEDLSRAITQAEVARLREALVGRDAFESRSWTRRRDSRSEGPVVGYVCGGASLETDPGEAVSVEGLRKMVVVAVADHVNLTWRSPLAGKNDESVGPRFPSMSRIYAPEVVQERLRAQHGIIVRPEVVAGVGQGRSLDAYESETAAASDLLTVSSELVPVAIVAAHMGLRIAAAVVTTGKSPNEEMGSGRS